MNTVALSSETVRVDNLDKCTIVIQVPEEVRKMYCERLSDVKNLDKMLKRIIIFISEHGHIKVCADVNTKGFAN